MNKFKTEADIAPPIIKYLEKKGWEVFGEIQMAAGSPICDLVARKEGKLWAIEMKKTFSLAVIAQAGYWKMFTHFTSVAVPLLYNNTPARDLALSVCYERGIGVFLLTPLLCSRENDPVENSNPSSTTNFVDQVLFPEQRVNSVDKPYSRLVK